MNPECTTSGGVTVCYPPPAPRSDVSVYSQYVGAVTMTVLLVVIVVAAGLLITAAAMRVRRRTVSCPACDNVFDANAVPPKVKQDG